MNDKNFEETDKKWMEAMKPLREKEVSEGILKGFSASVERRILAKQQTEPRHFRSPAWAPALAVMVLASVVVLRSPIVSTPLAPRAVDYAQLSPAAAQDLEDDIAALKELGAWSDEDDSVLGSADDALAQELELSAGTREVGTTVA